jgi:D-methionine transport system ATP-binding protein
MTNFIEIDNVCKSYTHQNRVIHALQNISLSIEKGDVYGIIGMSGAGKSTLMRCLSTLIFPTSGQILFDKNNLAQMTKNELRSFRKNIGMIFQHFNLLSSRNVADNIAYPLEILGLSQEHQNKRVDELLELVGLKEKKMNYPSQLSGGEKQRVGIARALASHPKVLLCDEATSALDPKTTQEILNLLKKINRELNVTIVLITHEMEVIKQICNKVAVIEKGSIVEKGSVFQVFADPKHSTTKHFLQNSSHEIPAEFFKNLSNTRKLLRLQFKGTSAGQPVIAELIRRFNVDANILMGWLDQIQSQTVGTLVIELTGSAENIQKTLSYLNEKFVNYELLENECK